MILANDPRTTYECLGLFTALIRLKQHLTDHDDERKIKKKYANQVSRCRLFVGSVPVMCRCRTRIIIIIVVLLVAYMRRFTEGRGGEEKRCNYNFLSTI